MCVRVRVGACVFICVYVLVRVCVCVCACIPSVHACDISL